MNRRSFIRGLVRVGAGAAVVAAAPKVFDLGRLQQPWYAPYQPIGEYYTIAWPVPSRAWHFGTYVHDVLEAVPPPRTFNYQLSCSIPWKEHKQDLLLRRFPRKEEQIITI